MKNLNNTDCVVEVFYLLKNSNIVEVIIKVRKYGLYEINIKSLYIKVW